MEIWKLLIGIGAVLTPAVLTVMARDRSLMSMINTMQTGLKDQIEAKTAPLHERVNRVRDEYVRRDDLDGHLSRMEKQFDDIRSEMRRGSAQVEQRLNEVIVMLSKTNRRTPG